MGAVNSRGGGQWGAVGGGYLKRLARGGPYVVLPKLVAQVIQEAV